MTSVLTETLLQLNLLVFLHCICLSVGGRSQKLDIEREMHKIRSVNESYTPLDLSFPVDLPLPVDSQFSVNPRRSTILWTATAQRNIT